MTSKFNLNDVKFRILNSSDSIVEINALLKAAYKPLSEAGMRYAASHEEVDVFEFHQWEITNYRSVVLSKSI